MTKNKNNKGSIKLRSFDENYFNVYKQEIEQKKMMHVHVFENHKICISYSNLHYQHKINVVVKSLHKKTFQKI